MRYERITHERITYERVRDRNENSKRLQNDKILPVLQAMPSSLTCANTEYMTYLEKLTARHSRSPPRAAAAASADASAASAGSCVLVLCARNS